MEMLEYPFDNEMLLKKKKSIKRELLKKESFIEKRIAILSGSTIGEIKNILELFLLNQGIKPIFYEGQYGRCYEEVVFDNYELEEFKPEIIYIHTSNKNIQYMPQIDDLPEDIEEKLNSSYKWFEAMWQQIKTKYQCMIIQNNIEYFSYRVLGNMDCSDVHGLVNYINRLNDKINYYCSNNEDFYINDINYISADCGLKKWHDPIAWAMYKYALNIEVIPTLCFNVSNIIKSYLGKNKKMLILDLDNTIWGGVIGEVGVEGIELGSETPKGLIFSDIQRYIKELNKRGIMLGICSKNDEKNALDGLTHRSSQLKKNDFVAIKANWSDKHINISEMAEEANILLDSIVFLDDNLVEREIVMSNIAQVAVINASEAEKFLSILDKSGFFEPVLLSADDIKRNEFYQSNIKREQDKKLFGDMNEYLNSLNMISDMYCIEEAHVDRITQLINKTNQFNLTGKRCSKNEVINFKNQEKYIGIVAKLEDKFGDNGIVSVLIGEIMEQKLEIKLWVMSCRVFKRNLEHAILDTLIDICREKSIEKLIGLYSRTAKNSYVSELYKELGFKLISQDEGNSVWEYLISDIYYNKNKNKNIKVVYHGE